MSDEYDVTIEVPEYEVSIETPEYEVSVEVPEYEAEMEGIVVTIEVDNVPIELVTAEDITAGMAIRVDFAGKAAAAQADALATSDVFGFAEGDVATGFTLTVTRDRVTLADWTDLTGAASLTKGATYYLHPTIAGGITTTAPVTAGQCVVEIGEALTEQILAINISPAILL